MTRRADIPVFIVCRDRLTYLRQLLEWLGRAGLEEIYLLDNDSRFPPLLDFYSSCPHEVIRLNRNMGRLCLFAVDGLTARIGRRPFVYTDPDVVPVEECPLDAMDRFSNLLTRYPSVSKVGFGLKIDDIPHHYRHRRAVLRWERQFWRTEVEPGVFAAPLDTTFALYRDCREFSFEALRTGAPYLARHMTWYTDDRELTVEEHFYRQRLASDTDESPGTSHWSGAELPEEFAQVLSRLSLVSRSLRSLTAAPLRLRRRLVPRRRLRWLTSRARSLLESFRCLLLVLETRRTVRRGPDFHRRLALATRHPVGRPSAITLNQRISEISSFCDLIRDFSPRFVLEIGTAGGGTSFLLAEAAAADAVLITVDLPPPDGYPRLMSLVYRSFSWSNQKIVPVRGDSHDSETRARIERILGPNQLDVLFIDGDHSAAGVAQDYETYRSLVRPGGVMAFHDIVPGRLDWVGGVPEFWRELRARRSETKEIVEDWQQGGWGIGVVFADERASHQLHHY
jgi:predicted O-methyltransferase YrrM